MKIFFNYQDGFYYMGYCLGNKTVITKILTNKEEIAMWAEIYQE